MFTRTGFSPWIPVLQEMVTVKGALNRESDASRVPPPLPSIVESYARNITIPAACSRPKTGDRCNHDNTSKHLTAPDPTTKVAPDQHHRRRGAPPSCRSPVSRTLQPTAARPQPSHSRPRPATTSQYRPQPAVASHSRSRPAPASHTNGQKHTLKVFCCCR
jgi:hypothetical protein